MRVSLSLWWHSTIKLKNGIITSQQIIYTFYDIWHYILWVCFKSRHLDNVFSDLRGALLHPNKYSFEQLKLFGHPQLILV